MLVWVAAFLALRASDAASILGFLPFHGTSHNMNTVPLFVELAKRGHNVTLAGFHPPKMPVSNLEMIQFKTAPGVVVKASRSANDYENPNHMTTMRLLRTLYPMYHDNIGINNNFSDIFNKRYDLLIVEMFESDLFMGFVSKIDAPFIIIHNCEPLPWHRLTLGDPLAPSVIPQVFGQRASRMDFAGRFWNTVEILELLFEYRTAMLPRAQAIAEKYLGPLPPLHEVTKNASLYFTNTHSSLFGSRAMNPSTIEIGGLHVSTPKSLPKVC
ncbi:hypothetical protein GE061_011559 [Apolygus lucorum]|uniref:UDP-glycosyltransferase n=1 Tax=Apolygus lucorum TaxID=248454 RepID=A0A8S9XY56_APOLU|nr:hypothetical protein GE061_011559 [Apolygus lucorum]